VNTISAPLPRRDETLAGSKKLIGSAVHRHRAVTREGLQERLFTVVFGNLVYAQIWEDPVVDLEALEIDGDSRMVVIASGGCNVMSYLSASPAHITAVDLNRAHVALNRLKLAAAEHLPSHAEFQRFFARADDQVNVDNYHRYLRATLDPETRAYWEGRDITGRRRITRFARNIYRYGLLGRFISAAHLLARLHGSDPRRLAAARDLEEQRRVFETELAPLLDRFLVRWLIDRPAALFGLGIPPQQYKALAADHDGGIAAVLHQRLERLACGFALEQNYFARQAFARRYDPAPGGSIPPYLELRHFDCVRANAPRVDVRRISFTEHLRQQPAASLDRYVLLDAQDWMSDEVLTELWTEITRTSRPGARVIFRTAAAPTLLPGRVPDAILSQWHYEAERSRAWTLRDRSAIYGGFHLYIKSAGTP
jgi:S-adenosylmethionine-diacylglycerol 3-amino-3-carboxypropyl transferase